MASWFDMCVDSPSDNTSSARTYDREGPVATSTSSTVSSASTLGLWLGDDNYAETQQGYGAGRFDYDYDYDYDYDCSYNLAVQPSYSYGGREDLGDDVVEELRNVLKRTIPKTLPLSPELSYAPLYLPQRSLQEVLESLDEQPPEPRTAPFAHATREKATRSPPAPAPAPPQRHFQTKAFASLGGKRQPFSQRRPQTATFGAFGTFGNDGLGIGKNKVDAFNSTGSTGVFGSSNWRREQPNKPVYSKPQPHSRPQSQGRGNPRVSSMHSKASAATSWRKTDPGTEWKWNEKTKGYTLMKL